MRARWFVFLIFLSAQGVQAANLYWVAGGSSGTFSTAANWSATSGGAGGAGIPGTGDNAIFDGGRQSNCFFNAAISVSSITISTAATGSYTGFVDLSSRTLTVQQNFTVSRSTFYARTSSITVNGNWTVGSAGQFVMGTSSVTFRGSGAGNTIDTGRDNFYKLGITGSGSWSTIGSAVTVSSFIAQSAGTLTITGVSSMTVAGTFNKTGGTLALDGDLEIGGGNFLNTSGSIIAIATTTVSLSGPGTLGGAGSIQVGNLTLSGNTQTTTLGSALTVTGNLTNNTGHTLDPSGTNFSITITSNLINTGNYTVRTASMTFTGLGPGLSINTGGRNIYTLRINGSGQWTTVSNAVSIASHVRVDNGTLRVGGSSSMTVVTDIFIGASGVLEIHGNLGISGGDLQNSGSVLSLSTPTLALSGAGILGGTGITQLPHLTMSGNGLTTSLGGHTSVLGSLSNTGTHILNATVGNFGVTVSSSWSNAGTYTAQSSSVTFNGTVSGLTIAPGTQNFYMMRFNGLGGAWTPITNQVTVSSHLYVDAGTFQVETTSLTVTGDVSVGTGADLVMNNHVRVNGGNVLNAGTLETTVATSTLTIVGAGTLGGSGISNLPHLVLTGVSTTTLAGNITAEGQLTNSSGHGLDVSGGDYQITASSSFINSGAFTAQQGTVVFTGTGTLTGSTTFYNFASTTPGAQLIFAAGTTQYITNDLTLTGGSGNLIRLRSTANNAPFGLKATGNQSIDFVNVRDSYATMGNVIQAANSTNTSNNRNWDFGAMLHYWWGTLSTDWTVGGNWHLGYPPLSSNDSALIVSTATRMPTLTSDIAVSTLTVVATSSLTLAGFDVTVSSFALRGILALRGSEHVSLAPDHVAGSTVSYIGTTGPLPILSTWTYQNILINGPGAVYVPTGDLTVSRNWTRQAGTVLASGHSVLFNATVTGLLITSGGQPFEDVIFNGTGGFWTLQDSMTVISTVTIQAGTLDTRAAGSYPIVVGGDWIKTGGTFNVNASSIVFSGSTTEGRIGSGNSNFRTIMVEGPGTWRGVTDPITVSTVIVNGGMLFVMAGSSLSVTGDMNVNGGGTFAIEHDVAIRGGDLTNAGAILANSTSTLSLSGTGTLGGAGITQLPQLTMSGNAQTTTLGGPIATLGALSNTGTHVLDTNNGNNFAITVSSGWSNAGTFTVRNASVTFNGTVSGLTIAPGTQNFYMMRFNGLGGAWTPITNQVTVSSHLYVDAGTFQVETTSLTVTGDVSVGTGADLVMNNHVRVNGGNVLNAGTLETTVATSTLTIVGAGTLGGSGISNLPHLVLTGVSTTTLAGNITAEGQLTNSSGHGLDVSGGDYQITASSSFINSGAFTAQQGTVVFTGTGTLTGSTTFYNFASTTPGAQLIFAAGTTQYITNDLTLTGGSGNLIRLRSTANNAPFGLKATGNQSIDFVNVRDSYATMGNVIQAANSTNTSNNRNWDFGAMLHYWWGTLSTDWTVGGNWHLGYPPLSSNDSALIVSTATRMPTLTSDIAVSTLTVVATSSLTLAGFDVTVSSFALRGILALRGSEHVSLAPDHVAGSTVSYIGTTGPLPILSTWTYQNILINGPGAVYVPTGDLTVSRNWTRQAGTVLASGHSVLFNATVTGLLITSGGQPFEDVIFNGTGGFWTLQDSMTVISTVTIQAGTLDTRAAGSYPIVVGGDWIKTGGTFNVNASSIVFSGSTTEGRIGSGNSNFRTIMVEGPGTWRGVTDPITVSTVIVNGGMLFVMAGSSLSVTGDMNVNGGGTFAIEHDVAIRGGDLTNAGAILANSTSTLSLSGTGTLGGAGITQLPQLTMSGNAQTTTLGGPIATLGALSNTGTHVLDTNNGNNFAITVSSGWSNAGTFTVRNASVTFNGTVSGLTIAPGTQNFYMMRFNGLGGAWTPITNQVTVSSHLYVDAGTFQVETTSLTVTGDIVVVNGANLDIGNDVVVNGGDIPNDGTIISLTTATVTVNGAGTIGGSGNSSFPRLTLSGAAQTTVLGGDIIVLGSMTIAASHILDANSSGNFLITISSHWANLGTFTAHQGLVLFNSTSTLTGSTAFYDLNVTEAGITLTFPLGSTQTVTGTLNLAGDSGNRIRLRSSSGNPFFHVAVSSIVSHVDVQNVIASSQTIYAGRASIGSGVTTLWVFDYYPGPITDLVANAQLDGDIFLSWTAPLDPDDNPLGVGSQYAVQWATYSAVALSTSSAADTGFTLTHHQYISTSAVSAGTFQVRVSTGLTGGTTYYYRAWTMDPLGVWSMDIPNQAQAVVQSILGLTLSPTYYHFGSVPVGTSTGAISAISVRNDGNRAQTYSLSISTTDISVWNVRVGTPTVHNEFVMFGAFNATAPVSTAFDKHDVILTSATIATPTQYSVGGETGVSVPPTISRSLWLRLEMPPTTATITPQTMALTVSASSSP